MTDKLKLLAENCAAAESDAIAHSDRWSEEPWQDVNDATEGRSLSDVAQLMHTVRLALDSVDSQKKILQKAFDQLRLKVIPDMMDEQNITSVKIAGLGRLGLTADMHVSTVKEKKLEMFDWLRDTGRGDSIQETVNASTLKAMVKQMIREGEEIPDGLLNVNPFTRASITKS